MIELFQNYVLFFVIGLLLGLLIIALIYIFYLIMKIFKNKKYKMKEEKKQMFYCEVEQWGKCREQCEICKKI
jgi:uncharacterized membrane protein YciS (DUF1049 family)